jgi:hypothetical protein
VVPQKGNDLSPAWTAGAGLAGYAWMVLACANPKDTGQTSHPLCRIDLIVIASVISAYPIHSHWMVTNRSALDRMIAYNSIAFLAHKRTSHLVFRNIIFCLETIAFNMA